MSYEEINSIARELWWPHHASRTREIALADLDGGSVGAVTVEFGDIVDMVRHVLEQAGKP